MALATYAADASAPREEGWLALWNRFWFQPSDPTTLGLMRIAVGVLTLYVHLCYTFDLQQFFGKDAWLDLKAVNELRHNSPRTYLPGGWPKPEGADEPYEYANAKKPLTAYTPAERLEQLQLCVAVIPWLSENHVKPLYRPSELATPRKDQQQELERQQALLNHVEHFVNLYYLDPRSLLDKDGKPLSEEKRHDILEFAQKHGIDPRKADSRGYPWFSIWFHVVDPTWMEIVHIGFLAVIVLFTLGIGTRITSVLTWLGAISYIHRAPTALFGQDTMMNILLIYLMIGPCGAALSVDRLIQRWWARRRGLEFSDRPQPSVSANFAYRLIVIHCCMIYLFAGTSKLQGGTWWNGTAIWYTISNNEFAPLNRLVYRNALKFLCTHRWLWAIAMMGGCVHTLFVELCFPFLVWHRRLRWFMLMAASLLHAGIALLMGLTVFQLYLLVFLLAFYPQSTVHRLIDVLRETLRATVSRSAPKVAAPRPATVGAAR